MWGRSDTGITRGASARVLTTPPSLTSRLRGCTWVGIRRDGGGVGSLGQFVGADDSIEGRKGRITHQEKMNSDSSSSRDENVSLTNQMTAFKDSVDDLKSRMSSRDVMLKDLVSRVAVMSESSQSEDLLDSLVGRTEILDLTGEKVTRMRRWYRRILSEGPISSCLLIYLFGKKEVKIFMDFDSFWIERMKKDFVDHDRISRNGSGYSAFSDLEEKKVYMAGKVGCGRTESYRIGMLTGSLCQMAVYLFYGNGGRPYSKGDEENERRFKGILEEAEEKVRKRSVIFDYFIKSARTMKTEKAQMIYLLSAVPRMIVHYGSSEGTMKLEEQMPSLLQYYIEMVMEPLLMAAS